MGAAEISAIVAVIALLINLGLNLFDRAKRGERMNAALQRAIHAAKLDSAKEFSELRTEISLMLDSRSREFGEVGIALRNKIQEVELYIRDNYVRRDSFNEVTARIAADLAADVARVETHLTRLEGKIDKWTPSGPGVGTGD